MITAAFALVPAAPALAALVLLGLIRRDALVARVTLLALAGSASALAIAAALGGDRIAVFAGGAAVVLAALVAAFATRAIHGGTTPYRRFFATLLFAAAGALGVAVASDLRWLAFAWIGTGIATSALLAVAPGAAARQWAFRHARVEAIGDLAWIVLLVVVGRTYGTFDLHAIGTAIAPGTPAVVIACAIVAAGAARSVLLPLHAWLPNSMEAPTPVSAFMHAGLVNGTGVLFAKCAPLVAAAPGVLVAVGVLGGLTALYGAWMSAVRPEAKRRLGWSTVAQMGWMTLQCGCGAFAAALVHLAAHGGYKASRFLGVAGTVVESRRARERGLRRARRAPVATAFFALAVPSAGVGFAFAAAHEELLRLPAHSAVAALAWMTGVVAARAMADTVLDLPARIAGAAAVAGGVGAYLLAATALDRWLGAALPHVDVPVLPPLVAALAVASGLLRASGVRTALARPLRDRLYVFALTEGRAIAGGAR